MNGSYKRPLDLTLLVMSQLVLFPVWLSIWIIVPFAIWVTDRGPVFYCQQRAGKNGQVFTVRKFRTMVPDAERKGPTWTIEGDLRLTKVGRVLRRTAIDEMPELWNILKGEMSIVGPRALEVREHKALESEIPGFHKRLSVRPGLTGLAQVYDRADEASVKFAYDLQYIQSMNVYLDFKLIVLSVKNTVSAKWDRRIGKPAQLSGKRDSIPQPSDQDDEISENN